MARGILSRFLRRAVRHLRPARLDSWLASAERRRVLALVEEYRRAADQAAMDPMTRATVRLTLLTLRSKIARGEQPQ